jgi:hypothetical protein
LSPRRIPDLVRDRRPGPVFGWFPVFAGMTFAMMSRLKNSEGIRDY